MCRGIDRHTYIIANIHTRTHIHTRICNHHTYSAQQDAIIDGVAGKRFHLTSHARTLVSDLAQVCFSHRHRHTHTCMYVCVYVYVVFMSVCMFVYTHIYTHTCTCVCTYACVYARIHDAEHYKYGIFAQRDHMAHVVHTYIHTYMLYMHA